MSYKDLIPGGSSSGLDVFRNPFHAAARETQAKLDACYRERGFVVAALAMLATLSSTTEGAFLRYDDSPTQDPDWPWVVCIGLHTGEVAWHIHRDELPLFSRLIRVSSPVGGEVIITFPDGHSIVEDATAYVYTGYDTTEKYRRIYEYVTGEKE